MESQTPFDLNRRIEAWRQSLAAAGAMTSAQLDELEDHLRSSCAKLQETGLSAEEAFTVASGRVGSRDALAREYFKENPDRILTVALFGIFLRHPRKILSCTIAGIIGATGIFFFHRPPYQSQAMMFIRYVGTPDNGLSVGASNRGSLDVMDNHAGRGIWVTHSPQCGIELVNEVHVRRRSARVERDSLPAGMSGDQLAERLLADKPALRIVYTSGYSSEMLTSRVPALNSSAVLPKPFSADAIAAIVRRQLDGGSNPPL